MKIFTICFFPFFSGNGQDLHIINVSVKLCRVNSANEKWIEYKRFNSQIDDLGKFCVKIVALGKDPCGCSSFYLKLYRVLLNLHSHFYDMYFIKCNSLLLHSVFSGIDFCEKTKTIDGVQTKFKY